MSIIVNLDVMMARRKISLGDLANRMNLTASNLSILKTGKAKAIRFSTLDLICKTLDCQPGDILEYRPDDEEDVDNECTLSPPSIDNIKSLYTNPYF